jgi:hypothetical protein
MPAWRVLTAVAAPPEVTIGIDVAILSAEAPRASLIFRENLKLPFLPMFTMLATI